MKKTPLLFVCLFAAVSVIKAQDFYGSGIQDIRLEIPVPHWEQYLDSIKRYNPEARVEGSVVVNGVRYDGVGIRYKGNSSYFRTSKETLKKLPFNIKLDYKNKTQRLPGGYSSIKLSNAFLDPSFIRDPLSYEIVRKYMPAPMCNFVRLTVNGQYYGVYINTESIDPAFLKKHFGFSGGHIVKCDPDQWEKVRSRTGCPKGENASLAYLNDSPGCYDSFYEVDDPAAWKDLLNLIKILNKRPAEIEKVLDVDQALWMLALNNAMVNLDSYNGSLSHNYYLWFDTTGVAHPLIWDLNMSFGGWRRNFSFEEMNDQQLIQYQPLAEFDNAKRPLISQLLKNGYYRKIYLAHLRTIVNDWLVTGAMDKRAQAMLKEIDTAVKQDNQKLYTYEDFQKSLDQTMTDGPDHIIGIRQLMSKRTEYLSKHPLLNKAQPLVSMPTHQLNGEQYVFTCKLENATAGFVHYRSDKMLSFNRTPLYDDGTHGDATAGDSVFSTSVPASSIQHYYFSAENADAAATLPERASFEFLNIK